MQESRYEIGKQYLIHDKWLATSVCYRIIQSDAFGNIYIGDIGNEIIVTGFVFDDNDIHEKTNIHGFQKDKDGLYYFSNDASIVESIQTIRDNKIKKLLQFTN